MHYEFDFRDLHSQQAANSSLGVPMDRVRASPSCRTSDFKYVHFAALPPLFFDLQNDPGQFVNRAGDPAYAARLGEYAAQDARTGGWASPTAR